MKFKRWMLKVNEILSVKIGMDSRDLPDAPWNDWFNDELTPRQAIEAYFEDGWDDSGFGEEMLEMLSEDCGV